MSRAGTEGEGKVQSWLSQVPHVADRVIVTCKNFLSFFLFLLLVFLLMIRRDNSTCVVDQWPTSSCLNSQFHIDLIH